MYVVDIRCDHRNSVATQGFKEFIDGQHRAGCGNGEPSCYGITETLIEIETEPRGRRPVPPHDANLGIGQQVSSRQHGFHSELALGLVGEGNLRNAKPSSVGGHLRQ